MEMLFEFVLPNSKEIPEKFELPNSQQNKFIEVLAHLSIS